MTNVDIPPKLSGKAKEVREVLPFFRCQVCTVSFARPRAFSLYAGRADSHFRRGPLWLCVMRTSAPLAPFTAQWYARQRELIVMRAKAGAFREDRCSARPLREVVARTLLRSRFGVRLIVVYVSESKRTAKGPPHKSAVPFGFDSSCLVVIMPGRRPLRFVGTGVAIGFLEVRIGLIEASILHVVVVERAMRNLRSGGLNSQKLAYKACSRPDSPRVTSKCSQSTSTLSGLSSATAIRSSRTRGELSSLMSKPIPVAIFCTACQRTSPW